MLQLPEFELELPLSKELNLRHHGWIQFATIEFDSGSVEVIKVKNVGLCSVTHICNGLVELKKEGGL